jgi:hypothetical protein
MLSHSLQNHQTLPFTAAAPLPLHRCRLLLPFTAVINLLPFTAAKMSDNLH